MTIDLISFIYINLNVAIYCAITEKLFSVSRMTSAACRLAFFVKWRCVAWCCENVAPLSLIIEFRHRRSLFFLGEYRKLGHDMINGRGKKKKVLTHKSVFSFSQTFPVIFDLKYLITEHSRTYI